MSQGGNKDRRCEIVGQIHAVYSENETAVVISTIFLPRAGSDGCLIQCFNVCLGFYFRAVRTSQNERT